MIFVTVGNYNAFPRLVNAVEDLKRRQVIDEEVFLQVAGANFQSSACQVARFVSPAEFARLMHEASVIVTHAGCGTLIDAFVLGKVPVVMPRQHKYGEHVDDHQVELAEVLAAENKIVLAWEAAELPAAIEQARRRSLGATPLTGASAMISLVSQAVDELLSARTSARRR